MTLEKYLSEHCTSDCRRNGCPHEEEYFQIRQSVLEEVREKIKERKKMWNDGNFWEKTDELKWMMYVINELEKPEPDQVTSLINNLIEEN